MIFPHLPPVLSGINVRSEARINPSASLAEGLIEQKCREFGIWLPQLEHYTTMSSQLYPQTSTERLVAIGLYMNFLFYVDDSYDRHRKAAPSPQEEIAMRKVFENCVNIMLYGRQPTGEHILYPVCFEMRRLFLEHTDQRWLSRLVQSTLAHLNSSTYTLNDIIGRSDDITNSYISLRVLDSGMYPTIDCLEFAQDIFLPDEIIHHDYLRQMRQNVSKVGALSNDLFSFTKEIIGTNSRFNLVCVLMDYERLSFEQAVSRSVDIVNRAIDDFYRDAENIPQWGDSKIDRMVPLYIRGLEDQIVASWHWQISTNRYRSPDSPFPELRVLL